MGVAEFPVTVKRPNSIGNVLTISCLTIKDALKILKRFQERGYREVRIVGVAGHIVDESEFLMPEALMAKSAPPPGCGYAVGKTGARRSVKHRGSKRT
jgi:hypothetical protein